MNQNYKGHVIKKVNNGSIAMELGLEAGDELLSVNGEEILDVFDYELLMNDVYVEVMIKTRQGEECLLKIEKDEEEDLGVEFGSSLMDSYRACSNKCIFCFIDQMPRGMRKSLYFKDDDSRLSFLQGNYVTLTNMDEAALDRIIRHRLSPINISVRTTEEELRIKMLGNKKAGLIKEQLKKLYDGGISMNAQIVLCKGVNDKEHLKKTIEDLSEYMPYMESVSVVPVGITKYRDGLYPLEPFDKNDAIEVIELVEGFQKTFYISSGSHFIHASDEWYILGDIPFPEGDRYDGYLQLENGVGMVTLLQDEFEAALAETEGDDNKRHSVIVTGILMEKPLGALLNKLKAKFPNTKVSIYPVINRFFGERITVAGLLTGKDIIDQLRGKVQGMKVLITEDMLKYDTDLFLDDTTLKEVEDALDCTVAVVRNSGASLLSALLE